MRRTTSPSPGSPEWIALRRSGIGATDAATVCGRNRFSSPFEKFAELRGTTAPKIATDAMEWGTLLQPVVGAAWGRLVERKVRACPWTYWLEDGIYSHYDFDVLPPKGQPVTEILEVKTASAYAQREYGEENTAEIPEGYQLQCQHEMMCRPGVTRCFLAVLIGGQKLRSYVVERDDAMIEDLLRIERRFLADSRAGIPPPVDGSEAATAYLRNLHPHDDESRWDLPDDVEEIATSYLAASAAVQSAEEAKKSAANRLREAVGDHATAVGRLVKVSLKNNKDSAVIDWQGVALHLMGSPDPDMIAQHTTVKPGARPLIVTYIGD